MRHRGKMIDLDKDLKLIFKRKLESYSENDIVQLGLVNERGLICSLLPLTKKVVLLDDGFSVYHLLKFKNYDTSDERQTRIMCSSSGSFLVDLKTGEILHELMYSESLRNEVIDWDTFV